MQILHMKRFEKHEIEGVRRFLEHRRYPQKEAHLDGRVVHYFVVPRNMFQMGSALIPYGLMRATGSPQDGYVIGVSDEVPRAIKDHFAVSEHDEFMVYGIEDPDRALHSEQNMMRSLEGSDQRIIYRNRKMALYTHLIEHSRNNLEEWGYTAEDHAGFVRALEFLRAQ